jgi:hypothetical protein
MTDDENENELEARPDRWPRIEAARKLREEWGREPSEAEINAQLSAEILAKT